MARNESQVYRKYWSPNSKNKHHMSRHKIRVGIIFEGYRNYKFILIDVAKLQELLIGLVQKSRV
jgi:hypothetical protein